MDRNQALTLLAEEAATGEISFPANAQVVLKIKRTLDDPDCHLETAGKLFAADPLLSAQVVAMANSVAYNPSGREISDVRTAVSRLGFQTLRTLVMAQLARQMAGSTATAEQQRMTAQLWEHSAHVAALARVIARRVSRQNPETALFTGLVHEIGGFYLLSRSDRYPCLLAHRPPVEQGAGEQDVDRIAVENTLGLAVLRQLAVPTEVIEAIDQYAQGYLSMPPKTLGDTLMLADYLAPVPSPLLPAETSHDDAALDFSLGEHSLADVLAESSAEVASLSAALNA